MLTQDKLIGCDGLTVWVCVLNLQRSDRMGNYLFPCIHIVQFRFERLAIDGTIFVPISVQSVANEGGC